LSECRDDVYDSRGIGAERFDLCPITASARETDRFDLRALGRTSLTDVLRFTGGFRYPGAGVVSLDVHADLRARETRLHVPCALSLLHFDALILSGLLLLEGFYLLICNLPMREHGDHVLRENHVLNIDALGFDLILLELFPNAIERFLLHPLPGFNEADRRHVLQGVAEMVADRCLQNFVYQVLHGADHGNDAGRLRVRHVNLDLEVNLEDEAFLRLRDDLLELRIQIVGFADRLRPVQIQNSGRHDFRLVTAWVERILARAQGFLPNATMAGTDKRTILEVGPGSVLR